MQIDSPWIGVAAFVLAPLLVWFLCALTRGRTVRERGVGARLVALATAFVAGSDGRLSLSRLQAFVWTLVAIGAYMAVTAVHVPYSIAGGSAAARIAADSAASRAHLRAARLDTARAAARDRFDASVAAHRAASDSLGVLTARATALAARAKSDSTLAAAAAAALTKQHAAEAEEAARLAVANQAAAAAQSDSVAAWSAARADSTTRAAAERLHWIAIPASLLTLMGISIGTGVFATLISATSGEGKSACVTALDVIRYDQLPRTELPELGVARATDWPCAVIYGRDFGTDGHVRVGADQAEVLYWRSDGQKIVVQLPPAYVQETAANGEKRPRLPDGAHGLLVVDTPNGKLVYELVPDGAWRAFRLGGARTSYEWLDLFRDDRNPSSLALTKFQMFGWTLVTVGLYAWTVLHGLFEPAARYVGSLPEIESSLVVLTGVSQAGYLVGKAFSSIGSNARGDTTTTTAAAAGAAAAAAALGASRAPAPATGNGDSAPTPAPRPAAPNEPQTGAPAAPTMPGGSGVSRLPATPPPPSAPPGNLPFD